MSDTLIRRIDALLPQTQCTRCGYEACLPYAQAIALDNEAINRCPPGGEQGVRALAQLLERAPMPLDPECGEFTGPSRAVIIEEHCIGCTLCIQACPVDAIVGANKLMHTVLADTCTGCELCLPPCPVDCITMVPTDDWTVAQADQARRDTEQRRLRLQARHAEDSDLAARTLANKPMLAGDADQADKRQASIAAALARARARRVGPNTQDKETAS
ncbi:RnfABCDGE type electron transport complex subunit B [Alcaligenes sp. SDU_A2]|uniref:RnfABCDGE type electron transport complex subunit B n=1 Tax=Alcaligenes sp. SDU_A2 TaxID=3136634 RepID=UPI00311E8FEC